MSNDVYRANGYEDREDYLSCLAEDYGVDLDTAEKQLSSIIGMHVPHSDLFDEAKAGDIWRHLVRRTNFNQPRHRLLVDIEMQPKFRGLSVGPEVTRRLQEEIQRAAGW